MSNKKCNKTSKNSNSNWRRWNRNDKL